MAIRVGNITIDCDDVMRVAQFWSAAMDRPLDDVAGEWFASIGGADPDRSQPAWYFTKVAEPKIAKNRMHVDVFDASPGAVDRLVGLGASVAARVGLGRSQLDRAAGSGRQRVLPRSDTVHWRFSSAHGNRLCVTQPALRDVPT